MSNSGYIKGRTAEYKTMRILEAEGYVCFRTAGSHGHVDVIAFLQKEGTELPIIRIIQCKAMKYLAKEDIKKLQEFSVPSIIQKEIWHYKPHQQVLITICQNSS